MDKFKIYTEQLYSNCTELVHTTLKERTNFNIVYESSGQAIFENNSKTKVQLSSTQMMIRYRKLAVCYRDNMIQFSTNGISYINDVVYIPMFHDFSFFQICTADELFQLSTLIDIKYITLEDIICLNKLREYFEYLYLKNNI